MQPTVTLALGPQIPKCLSLKYGTLLCCLLWLSAGFLLQAQVPTISPQGLVNAATFRSASSLPVAARGSLVTIWGDNLANATAAADSIPIPTQLSGTQVLFGGVAAPLLYVSPHQINAQVPFELPDTSSVDMLVNNGSGESAALRVTLLTQDPGVFVVYRQGSPVSSSNQISPGDTIIVFTTGLGPVLPPVPSGQTILSSPLPVVAITPVVKVWGQPVPVSFAGLAAGLVGVYRIDAIVSLNIQRGLADPTREVTVEPGVIPAVTGPPGPIGPIGPAGLPGATGPSGPAGPAGPMGQQGPLGLAGVSGPPGPQGPPVKFAGLWNVGTSYQVGDAVSFGGSSYINIQADTGHQPDTSAAFWSVLAQAGATGFAGPAGPAGALGPTGPSGPAGANGVNGATGADGPAGPPGVTWQGTWNNATAYALSDAVQFNGTSYISIQAGTGHQPDTSATFWSVLAQVGAPGSAGPAGPAGAAGPTGPTGPSGANGVNGATGADGPAGPPGVTWQGMWNNATAYALSDAVQFNGTSYISIQAGTGHQPDTSVTFWSVLAEVGAPGSAGPAGPAGAAGPTGPTGPSGANGVNGATGADGPAGPPGVTWQGMWNNATAYALSDAVQFNGTSYISIQAGTGHQPDTSATFWSVLAQLGAPGFAGPAGPAGAAGPTGPTGPSGANGVNGATGAGGPAGPPGVTWQGMWNNATAYALNDAVQLNGTSYISIQAGTGHQPDTSATFWSVLAQIGAPGSAGPAGPAGAAGPTGPTGPSGANGVNGATGADGPAGPPGVTWQGMWNNATAYALNDAVQFNGTSYISIQAGTGHQPDTSVTFWSVLAEGIQSYAVVSHQWINAIGSNGIPSSTQPAFSDVSGSVAASQLPTPGTSTLGGVKAQAAVPHQWINAISSSGQPSTTQPADADLSITDVTNNDVSTSAHGFAPKAPNTSGQWLRGDATWANAPGRLSSFTVITTLGASTYTRPANVTAILVECVGGGGGGGGTAGGLLSAGAAGSGGSGSYARKYITSPAATYSVSVGVGGTGGATGNNPGTAGNITTFGSTIVTCNGGSGGSGSAAGSTSIALGGAGGAVSTGGDLNAAGQAGGNGLTLSITVSASQPGGNSLFGGGATGVLNADGVAAAEYGAGGSGAATQGTTPRAGGNGSQGVIVVWEFL